jgi:hypothetical protein
VLSTRHDNVPVYFDPRDPVHEDLAQALGWDPYGDADPAQYLRFCHVLGVLEDAADRVRENYQQVGLPVNDARAKFARMCEHCGDGRSWVSIEYALGIPWVEQVTIISNQRPTSLWLWQEDDQTDFELETRAGASIRELTREHHLPYKQTRRIVQMVRGLG